MEPSPAVESSLVELLDRVLDRGLVLNADIIISLAGVPLVGIKLRAALAGMETMVRYGLMNDWDEAIRAYGLETRATPPARLSRLCRDDLLPATLSSPRGTIEGRYDQSDRD